MFKVTPNPPDLDAPDTDPPGSDSVSPYETLDPKKLHAAERALNFYLKPAVTMNNTERKPGTIYMIAPDVAHETLLVHACENMASARVMTSCSSSKLVARPSSRWPLGRVTTAMVGLVVVGLSQRCCRLRVSRPFASALAPTPARFRAGLG